MLGLGWAALRLPSSSVRSSIAIPLPRAGLQTHSINSLPNKINLTAEKALSGLTPLTPGRLNCL